MVQEQHGMSDEEQKDQIEMALQKIEQREEVMAWDRYFCAAINSCAYRPLNDGENLIDIAERMADGMIQKRRARYGGLR